MEFHMNRNPTDGYSSKPDVPASPSPQFLSIPELAQRWRCSRGSVYNRLRAAGAKVLDFASAGKRGKKVVGIRVVHEIEARNTKRLC
jgi:hypothetical protein